MARRPNRTQAALDMAAAWRAELAELAAIRTRESIRPLLRRDVAKRARLTIATVANI